MVGVFSPKAYILSQFHLYIKERCTVFLRTIYNILKDLYLVGDRLFTFTFISSGFYLIYYMNSAVLQIE